MISKDCTTCKYVDLLSNNWAYICTLNKVEVDAADVCGDYIEVEEPKHDWECVCQEHKLLQIRR